MPSMDAALPVLTLVLGLVLGEGATYLRERRAQKKASGEEWRAWRQNDLREALTLLDDVGGKAAGVEAAARGTGPWGPPTDALVPIDSSALYRAASQTRTHALLERPSSPAREGLRIATLIMETAGEPTVFSVKYHTGKLPDLIEAVRESVTAELRAMYETKA